jgi:hypothetical protein
MKLRCGHRKIQFQAGRGPNESIPEPLLRADAAAAEDLFEEALQAVDWARQADIDRERDEGVYVEPNVWTVHRPAMATWRDREPL